MRKKNKNTKVVEWYPVKEAARYAQLSVDMVNYLCRYEIVKPTGCSRRGRGCMRKYTFADVLLLRVISKLLLSGISVSKLRKSLITAQKRGKTTEEMLSKKYLVTDGKNIYFKDSNALELLSTGQLAFAFILELETVRNTLTEAIQKETLAVA